MSRRFPEIVVIGGGIIGCLTAWELARRGAHVTVVERTTPGHEATWAAAGMLLPIGESASRGHFVDLAVASVKRFADVAGALRDDAAIDIEYRACGNLYVALTSEEDAALRIQHEWQAKAGFDVHLIDADEAFRLEPALSPEIVSALVSGEGHQVNNRAFGQAAWSAAANRGARFLNGVTAAGVQCGPRGNATGVLLSDGGHLPADRVLIAAGAWSGQLAGLPAPLPVVPVRGQMLSVQSVPPVISRIVMSHAAYLVPRSGTQILVGATVEHAGFNDHTTPAGIRSLLDAFIEMIPNGADKAIVETWSGLRPGTSDDLPILGEDPAMPGLFYATGHYRNGILLAPITASITTAMLLDESVDYDVSAFSVRRFRDVV